MISLALLVILLICVALALSGCATTEPVVSSPAPAPTPTRTKIALRVVPTKLPPLPSVVGDDGDLALGDSIAWGIGNALGVRTSARVGEPSCPNPRAHRDGIGSLLYAGEWGRVVISAGVNDPPGACIAAIRRKLDTWPHGVVVWLVGLSQRHGEAGTVAAVAAAHGDRVVKFAVGPDGVHPRSYAEVAAAVRRAW